MLWDWIPVVRLVMLCNITLTIRWVLTWSSRYDGTEWYFSIAPLNIFLFVAAGLYVVFNARSELWLLLTLSMSVSLAFMQKHPLFHVIFASWMLSYGCCMLQLYDNLYKNRVVSMDMFIFLNLTFHAMLDLYDIWSICGTVTTLLEAEFSDRNNTLRKVTYTFAIAAIFFHSQSFPLSISRDQARKERQIEEGMNTVGDPTEKELCFERHLDGYHRKMNHDVSPADTDVDHAFSIGRSRRRQCALTISRVCWMPWKLLSRLIYFPPGNPHAEEYHAVVVARKRSAVISLLFVDVPFLIVRSIVVFTISKNATTIAFHDDITDVWFLILKNIGSIIVLPLWLRISQKIEGRMATHTRAHLDRKMAMSTREHVAHRVLDWLQRFRTPGSPRAADSVDVFRASRNFREILDWSGPVGTRMPSPLRKITLRTCSELNPAQPETRADSRRHLRHSSPDTRPAVVDEYETDVNQLLCGALRISDEPYRPSGISEEQSRPSGISGSRALAIQNILHHSPMIRPTPVTTFSRSSTDLPTDFDEMMGEIPVKKPSVQIEVPDSSDTVASDLLSNEDKASRDLWHRMQKWKKFAWTKGKRGRKRLIWRILLVLVGVKMSIVLARTDFYRHLNKNSYIASNHGIKELGTIVGVTQLAWFEEPSTVAGPV